jgi:hypothetical protein
LHVPTHILSGWCVANLLRLRPRERLGCMIAASAADVDGLGIVFGERYYHAYHHILGHNLFFALILAAVLCAFSRPRITFGIYLALSHLHLLMDYFGSGPLWDIYYLWPISRFHLRCDAAWEFFSWQNISAAGVLLVWTVAIARYQRRTPLEIMMPNLDRQLADAVAKRPRVASVAAALDIKEHADALAAVDPADRLGK